MSTGAPCARCRVTFARKKVRLTLDMFSVKAMTADACKSSALAWVCSPSTTMRYTPGGPPLRSGFSPRQSATCAGLAGKLP
jgi:hypothetical protein